jgi:hypothetical protein
MLFKALKSLLAVLTVVCFIFLILPQVSATTIIGETFENETFNTTTGITFEWDIEGFADRAIVNTTGIYLTNWSYNVSGRTFDFGFLPDLSLETAGNYKASDYYNILNVTVNDGITNSTISNFSGWIYSYNYTSFNETFNTTNGYIILNVTAGEYQIFVDNPNYAVDSNTNYQNVTATGNSSSANFTLLPDPSSVDISIFDEGTGSLLAQQVNITFTSSTNQYTYSTSSGEVFAGNLTAGTYNVRFETSGYSDRTYVLTVGERTTQTLNAYLTQGSETVTFNVEDSGTDEAIQGASFTMSAFVNGTIEVVESKTSDISGQVIFSYESGEAYIFTVSADGYIDKQFTLDPIQELQYTVTMQRSSDITSTQSYNGYRVVFTPKTYVSNQTGNFTWTITSSQGTLQNYSMSFCLNNNCTSYSGTNANGQTITHGYDLAGYGLGDEVNIDYTVLTTSGEPQSFSFSYPISGSIQSGLSDQQCTDYGLGVLDCIIAGTLMTVLVVGAAAYWAGSVAAVVIGMLALGTMYYIGIFSLWTIIITLIIGFVYIAWRAGK